MSRDPRYQKLLNSPRWGEVKRIVWARSGGLCERCRREGYITTGVDCHHKTPVESAKTEEEMRRLAYNVSNIELLCIPCHIKTHQEMRSHTKEKVKENKERARRRFLEANDPNYGEKADAYLKNLEEQAKTEDIIYPDDDPNKTPI
jgi:5-methylcytosine-specific restriction endonuclease McrA